MWLFVSGFLCGGEEVQLNQIAFYTMSVLEPKDLASVSKDGVKKLLEELVFLYR